MLDLFLNYVHYRMTMITVISQYKHHRKFLFNEIVNYFAKTEFSLENHRDFISLLINIRKVITCYNKLLNRVMQFNFLKYFSRKTECAMYLFIC